MSVMIVAADDRMWDFDCPVFTTAEPMVGRSKRFVYHLARLDTDARDERCPAVYSVDPDAPCEPSSVVCLHRRGHEGLHMPASVELIEASSVVIDSWGTR